MTEDFNTVASAHVMSRDEVAQFTTNAITASFIYKAEKQRLQQILDRYLKE